MALRSCFEWTREAVRMVPLVLLLVLVGAPASAEEGGENLISLQADSTSVVEILDVLAERSGLNIVTGPSVQGRTISIRMRESSFETALNLICRAAGLGFERVGNSILVADPTSLQQRTGLSTQVFDLAYADAEGVRKALEVITPSIKAEERSNKLLMWATASDLEQARHAVELLDQKPQQVLLEARLIEVNTSSLLEVGIDWEKLTKWSTVLSEGDPGPTAPGASPNEVGFTPINNEGVETKYFRQLETFEVAIDALVTDGHARLLSNTKVVTVDGQPAEIFAGETVPVVITSLTSAAQAGGVLQTVQLEKIDVGVRLNITPRVTDDGYITTLVEPEVSRIIAFVGPDDDLPQTSTRRARSLVRVKDGERIYLGGLLTEETRKTVKKVPLLGHIPILGHLFQHRREETAQLDLVIEITPHLVGDDAGTAPVGSIETEAEAEVEG
jgi:type II secretory pathway component GspD/PulD (secretin)